MFYIFKYLYKKIEIWAGESPPYMIFDNKFYKKHIFLN